MERITFNQDIARICLPYPGFDVGVELSSRAINGVVSVKKNEVFQVPSDFARELEDLGWVGDGSGRAVAYFNIR